MTETKLDDIDDINVAGFQVICKNRKGARKASGGIAVLVKTEIAQHIETFNPDDPDVLWLKVKQPYVGKETAFCLTYIPPENSRYTDPTIFERIEECATEYLGDNENSELCVLGDLNARTGVLSDIAEADTETGQIDVVSMYDEQETPPQERNSQDKEVNNYGERLIQMCVTLGLYIANGRSGTDTEGKTTCKNASVVDYILATPRLLKQISYFDVQPYDPMLSDIHCPVSATFVFTGKDTADQRVLTENESYEKEPRKPKWKTEHKDEFIDLISLEKIDEIKTKIEALKTSPAIQKGDINAVVSDVSTLLRSAAEKTNMLPRNTGNHGNRTKKSQRKADNKPWYDRECEDKRRTYFHFKNKYKHMKSTLNETRLKEASKAYKRQINQAFKAYKNNIIKEVRKLKTSDPKAYWKIINGDSKSKNENMTQISINAFKRHFEKLNQDNSNIGNTQPHDHNETLTQNLDDTHLNDPFTQEEVSKTISKLKLNKSSGNDQIINEFLRVSKEKLLTVYTDLFNIILNTGIIPDDWCLGYIKPLYKNNGSKDDPSNYRGITILSCFGKLFTCLLNTRLTKVVEAQKSIGPEQAGFRAGYSTIDHIFTLKILIDLYLNKKKRLYCCFIDYQKAFDRVPRVELWYKLLKLNIRGKVFNVIFNMYEKAKSSVAVNGTLSETFPCQIGVRQGENLSPLLFALYLSDIQHFLSSSYDGTQFIDSLKNTVGDNNAENLLKLYVLLYADDTIVLAESPKQMQQALTRMKEYCTQWKLDVNISKTKLVVFSRGKIRNKPELLLGTTPIEVVYGYKYLGTKFNYNGKFTVAKKELLTKGSRAMFSLLRKSRKLFLPIDIQLELFDMLVAPVVLYGCEVWAYEGADIVEKLKLRFGKYILGLNRSTCTNMVHGELGTIPLSISANVRTLSYWAKLVTSEGNKISVILYRLLLKLHEQNIYHSPWLIHIQTLLNNTGFPGIWTNQALPASVEWFKNAVSLRLKDQFFQKWSAEVFASGKCYNYRMFKQTFKFETYLVELPTQLRKILTKFRCRNHSLPVEKMAYRGISREHRICHCCQMNEIGDEYHYIFKCTKFLAERKKYIDKNYYNNPSSDKFHKLMNGSKPQLVKLCKFIQIILSAVNV